MTQGFTAVLNILQDLRHLSIRTWELPRIRWALRGFLFLETLKLGGERPCFLGSVTSNEGQREHAISSRLEKVRGEALSNQLFCGCHLCLERLSSHSTPDSGRCISNRPCPASP